MSLFASAFDTAPGPSTIASPALGKAHKDGKKHASHNNTSHKDKDKGKGGKKRTSLGGGGGGGGGQPDLQATQQNLAKLMKRVDAGEVRSKREGRESMGGAQSQGKGKKGRDVNEEDGEGAQQPGKKRKREEGGAGAGKSIGKASGKQGGTVSTSSQAYKQAGAGAKPPPAEIPLPHTIPKSQMHSEAVTDAGLTDMQRSMQAKLEGARFRWINEQLYSNPSTEAVAMMKKDPKIFADYHLTHRALTSAWPSPPLPHLIELLAPLPAKTLIVDLGCGDAGLAQALVPQGKIVLSYDLVGDSGQPGGAGSGTAPGSAGGWVVEADFLGHVPLPGRPGGLGVVKGKPAGDADGVEDDESAGEPGKLSKSQKRRRKREAKRDGSGASEVVDVVVCCLSLMGTNWIGGIYEACRVLKQGGTLHIAEVTSRFVSTDDFTRAVESFGFELVSSDQPSTHFTLFRFNKVAEVPQGAVRGEKGWTGRLKEGEGILRGCVYKKR